MTDSEPSPTLGKRKREDDSCQSLGIAPPSAYTFDSLIRITVGSSPNTRDFHIYKGLLTHYSTYFKAALNGNFKESKEGVILLCTDDPEVFQIVCYWLFTGQLWDSRKVKKEGEVPLSWRLLCSIFVFGDARGIPALRNAAIDGLMDKISDEWKLFTGQVKFIYQNTPKKSLLRKLAVDMVVKTYPVDQLKESECNLEYMMELAIALESAGKRRLLSQEEWRKMNNCDYHDHDSVAPPKS
ncbi:hypothetical protein H2199_002515 [Coniosporium tulheliwenetii]|nr:hypothetical protein H2199_002515 [Cladosporium sp. JES 115]